MNSEELIMNYLSDTSTIGKIIDSFSPLNPDEIGASQSVLAPWSLEAVSANTDIPVGEIRNFVHRSESLSLKEVDVDGHTVSVIESVAKLKGESIQNVLEPGVRLTVSQLMNLHVLQFVESKTGEVDAPVKIEDAIFDLKNTLFLPDDFMPEHLMGMVEGEPDFSLHEVRMAYAIQGNLTSIYFYQESKTGGFGRIRYIYPAKSGKFTNTPSNEDIRGMISSSFNSIQTEKSYVDFVNSRLIKTVIFNIEQKNTRELKRPIFNPGKIKILEDLGLVEKIGDAASIKESVTLDSLKELYASAKKEGQELAKNWLSTELGMN